MAAPAAGPKPVLVADSEILVSDLNTGMARLQSFQGSSGGGQYTIRHWINRPFYKSLERAPMRFDALQQVELSYSRDIPTLKYCFHYYFLEKSAWFIGVTIASFYQRYEGEVSVVNTSEVPLRIQFHGQEASILVRPQATLTVNRAWLEYYPTVSVSPDLLDIPKNRSWIMCSFFNNGEPNNDPKILNFDLRKISKIALREDHWRGAHKTWDNSYEIAYKTIGTIQYSHNREPRCIDLMQNRMMIYNKCRSRQGLLKIRIIFNNGTPDQMLVPLRAVWDYYSPTISRIVVENQQGQPLVVLRNSALDEHAAAAAAHE